MMINNMEKLSATTFSDAMIRCYENQNYKVGIAFRSLRRQSEFINELVNEYRTAGNPEVEYICKDYDIKLVFCNGSEILLFAIDYGRIEHRFNEILYDDTLSGGDVLSLRSFLCAYRIQMNDCFYESDDDGILDDFINSFTVVPENCI